MPIRNIKWNFSFFNPQTVWLTLQANSGRLGVDNRIIESELRNIAIAIDTRARILDSVVSDGKAQIPTLLDSILDPQLRNRMASLNDEDVYRVLRTIDSFFFESLSLYELIRNFYVGLLRRTTIEVGWRPHRSFDRLVQKTEGEIGFPWGKYLEGNRNLFVHQTAPYLAVQFKEEDLKSRELVIESETDVYLKVKELDSVLKGLNRLSQLCLEDLVEKISDNSPAAPGN